MEADFKVEESPQPYSHSHTHPSPPSPSPPSPPPAPAPAAATTTSSSIANFSVNISKPARTSNLKYVKIKGEESSSVKDEEEGEAQPASTSRNTSTKRGAPKSRASRTRGRGNASRGRGGKKQSVAAENENDGRMDEDDVMRQDQPEATSLLPPSTSTALPAPPHPLTPSLRRVALESQSQACSSSSSPLSDADSGDSDDSAEVTLLSRALLAGNTAGFAALLSPSTTMPIPSTSASNSTTQIEDKQNDMFTRGARKRTVVSYKNEEEEDSVDDAWMENNDEEDETPPPFKKRKTSTVAKGKGKDTTQGTVSAPPAPPSPSRSSCLAQSLLDPTPANRYSSDELPGTALSSASTSTHEDDMNLENKAPSATSTSSAAPARGAPVLQTTHCLAKVVRHFPNCHQCIARVSGHGCSFKGVRSFTVDAEGNFSKPTFISTTEEPAAPIFPTGYNEPFTEDHARIIKTVAAHHLHETLKTELEHAQLPRAVRLKSELHIQTNCDLCLSAILSGSFLCPVCARDVCFDCCEELAQYETQLSNNTSSNPFVTDRRYVKLCRCTPSSKTHTRSSFIPITRFRLDDLTKLVEDMGAWRTAHPLPPPPPIEDSVLERYYGRGERFILNEESLQFMDVPMQDLAPTAIEDTWNAEFEILEDWDMETPIRVEPRDPIAGDESQLLKTAAEKTLDLSWGVQDLFKTLWAKGEAMVCDVGDNEHYRLEWTPKDFIERYGQEPCSIYSNEDDSSCKATVQEFFETFGEKRPPTGGEKIKDWPSTTDFKTAFPELYEDFQNAIPCGFVTRRDGVLNIAAHMPHNANPPDLGPKGYFSQTSDDNPGGQGSTKLHMDVADAVNLMLWSGTDAAGLPGRAAWDLFRAEDADKIQDFIFQLQVETLERSGKTASVESLRKTSNDPIHSQFFYLDHSLRKRLWEEKGVKSWRIWQRPGQVVFIPAGCAHQVCNFADCIKVASDFVSMENVARCWKVTEEFRAQTKEGAIWRTDILQLKSQLLWAWRSCERF